MRLSAGACQIGSAGLLVVHSNCDCNCYNPHVRSDREMSCQGFAWTPLRLVFSQHIHGSCLWYILNVSSDKSFTSHPSPLVLTVSADCHSTAQFKLLLVLSAAYCTGFAITPDTPCWGVQTLYVMMHVNFCTCISLQTAVLTIAAMQ